MHVRRTLAFICILLAATARLAFAQGGGLKMPTADAENLPELEEAKLIDSDSADDRPTFTLDGQTMFFGSRRISKDPWRAQDNSDPRWKWDSDIWKRIWQDTAWSAPINLGPPVNDSRGQINPTVHPRGDLVYFVGGAATVNQAKLKEGTFQEVRPVGGEINRIYNNKAMAGAYFMDTTRAGILREMAGDSDLKERAPDAWQLHYNENMVRRLKTWGALNFAKGLVRCESAVFPDGRHVIFSENFGETGKYGFSGKGAEDLWIAQINERGDWDSVRAPSGDLNSEYEETYPFIAADGITLYFSSKRPCLTCPAGTSGGDDIYRTTLSDTGWTAPMALGAPFNSMRDDYGFSIGPDGETAYFVSNRSGKSKYYQVKLRAQDTLIKPKPVFVVQGRVTDAKTGKPLRAEIFVDDLTESKNKFSVTSDSVSGNYVLALMRGHRFGLQAVASDYLPRSERFTIPLRGTFDRTKLDLALAPVAVGSMAEFKNVYFAFGKATLLKESQLELDRVVQFLLQQPHTNIEIQGNTDDVGGDAVNMKLSQNRAISVMTYLVSKGVPKERLKAVGLGKSNPRSKEKTEEARALNRRVEMVITSKVD